MTGGTFPYRGNDARDLHQQALQKAASDPNKPEAERKQAGSALRMAKVHDTMYDLGESVVGERATQVISWPSRVVAGWFKDHADISDEDIARRANAYLSE